MANAEEKILEIFTLLDSFPTVSGYEKRNVEGLMGAVQGLLSGFFDTLEVTPAGGILLRRMAKTEENRTLLLTAHIDTVGAAVKELCGDGFVRALPVGGIDRRILPGAEVEIYGKETVRGIFASVPPHLTDKNGSGTMPDFSDFLIDTGKTKEELEALLPIGSPIAFVGKTERLLGNRVTSAHLDDKICCAAILYACTELCEHPEFDIGLGVLFATGEEKGAGGAASAQFIAASDGAVALDVNFAKEKDTPDYISGKLGEGAMISRSAMTDRRMTELVIDCAEKAGIPHKVICETEGTGTDADAVEAAYTGTPCAVLSVPIKYMHTPCETCDLADVLSVSRILVSTALSFEEASRRENTRLGVRLLKGGAFFD